MIDIIRISGPSVENPNVIIASENIFQTTTIETQLIDDNLSPTDNLFPFQTNYDLGSLPLDGTPIIESAFLEAGLFENDVYKFELSQNRDLDIFLDVFDFEDDAGLELYRDSNNNGELDFSDELLNFSNAVGSDAIFYPGAFADTYFATIYYFDGGSDSLIDYDLSIFTF